MFYHSYMALSGNKYLVHVNKTEDTVLKEVIIPFINGQVVVSKNSYGNDHDTLLNMKSTVALSIYKTEDEIVEDTFVPHPSGSSRICEKYEKYDCTSEFVERVKIIQASPAMKSLLQLAFQPPEEQLFVIMKFGDKLLDSAYDGVIKPLSDEYNLNAVRVDQIQDSGIINEQVLENIAKSKLIISDLSGERPNCYYETGFAHALGKNIILTIHKSSEIHFDLSSHRFIVWETESELRQALKTRLNTIMQKEN